jgi:hypothetical protein
MKIIILLITLIAFPLASLHAIGISVAPSQINLTTQVKKLEEFQLKLKNPSTEVAMFRVSLDNFDDWITPEQTSLTIDPQEEKKVTIKFRPTEEGVYSSNISVTSQPLSNQTFKAGAGVKVPLTITVSNNTTLGIYARLEFWIGVLDVLLILFLIWWWIKSRKLKVLES